jgi:hypothetical protein
MSDETVEEQEIDGIRHRPQVNQRRHEPLAGRSHHADEGHADEGRADEGRADKDQAEPQHHRTEPRDAVRDMMGGPLPQGDVPDAPATQIAAADEEEDGEGARVRYVANAVPGKPDGEVDTRFGYTGT